MDFRVTAGHKILLLAFFVRLVGVGITVSTDLNPDAGSDASGFARSAERIASDRSPLVFFENFVPTAWASFGSTYEFWGLFLAPFWFLPGPSLVYASVANALLGAFAVYNVYLIGRHYHSHRAGLLAAVPVLLFPSYVAIHSTVLREAIILFAFTTAVRMLVVPSGKRLLVRYAIVLALVPFLVVFRVENLPFFTITAGIGLLLYSLVYASQWPRAFVVGSLSGIGATYYAYVGGTIESTYASFHGYYRSEIHPVLVDSVYRGRDGLVEYVTWLRAGRLRAEGRTTYLAEIVPETVPEMIDFAPIAAIYFLFVPFPWMVETVADLVVAVETTIIVVYAAFGVVGMVYLGKHNLPLTVALLVGLVTFSVFYGLVTVNVGTATRHRQVFYWVIPLFGGIGIARLLEGNLYFRSIQRTWASRVREPTRSDPPLVHNDD